MSSKKLSYKRSFDVIGKEGVPRYKQSLVNNRRVATGRTKDSIRYVATDNKLTFYALDHTRTLETGQTPDQVKADSTKPDFFRDIGLWVKARNIKRGVPSVVSGLLEKGWEGSPGIISTIDDLIIAQTKQSLGKDTKSQILKTLKTTKPL